MSVYARGVLPGDIQSHCFLFLLSVNLQAAHPSILLEYLFPFFPYFVLCAVVVVFLQRWDQAPVLMHARQFSPRDTAPGLLHFYFTILFIILSLLPS